MSKYKEYRNVFSIKNAAQEIQRMLEEDEDLYVVIETVPREKALQIKKEIVDKEIKEAEERGAYEASEHLSGSEPF
ncbi:MAG: hypothetical protein GF334_08270 [Candidatus Altiarchaeales archaeon]|nr:hypothetical protein [Candidatus Altiarchaeales archaeon]